MAVQGVSIAFSDDWDVENPTWTQLDTGTPRYVVTGWTIDRGRQSELDKTTTGEAQIRITDWSGAFDPTYTSGTFYGLMDPMKQVAIALQNPVTASWSTLFRGFVSKWSYELDPTKRFLYVTIDCVDSLEVLANAELVTDQHGETVPVGSEGEIYYLRGSLEHPTDNQCEDRINAALDDAGWPSWARDINTGNVSVRPTIYAPRSPFLSVIDDACDAEFPGVANRFISGPRLGQAGYFTFQGRLARFNPTDSQYGITTWKVGDDAAVIADSDRAAMSPPFVFENDVNDVINAVYSAPQDIADADITGQWVSEATSVGKYGLRSLSFENLLTEGGYLSSPDATDLEETLSFAQYYVDNKATPMVRIPQITFKGRDKGDAEAAKVWAFLCGVDISDRIDLLTSHGWGGGFGGYWYVEGVHYNVSPGSDRQPIVELVVDISPAAYYDTNEWV